MAVSHTFTAMVGEGGRVEFVLPEAKEGEFVSLTVEPIVVKHTERFGWAPGSVVYVGPDFDKPYDVEP